ncbi:Aste57867_2618 [Aphanomyces stellatus]|uniref:Aste57867_2618 protein n=1 Tax=Aphanomyces stellatus TaxID=120398 RepID=A0A485K806_9STRA|nr:hypothetical protein As57867_002611 [Aphanomyces stellatus]VFT79814.1 Aste57867_2618 [Aphanomyces stellatus]
MSVLQRIRTLGPFQRVVLPHNYLWYGFPDEHAFANMTAEKVLKACEISDDNVMDGFSISHHILRISPTLGNAFRDCVLKPASNQIIEALASNLLKTNVKEMRDLLKQYMQTLAQ